MPVAIRTSQNVLLEYQPAAISERIVAALIDYLVIFGWAVLIIVVSDRLGLKPNQFFAALLILPVVFYDLLSEYFLNGRSVGKLAMGIRVVMLDGSQPGLGAYLIRWLLRIIESATFFLGIVPIITVAANGKGQRLGDIAAGTTVVRLKPAVSLTDVLAQPIPDTYSVQFPDVRFLTDRDVSVVREVLQRGDSMAVQRTAEKIKEVTGIRTGLDSRPFLETVLTDYQFITTQ